MTTTQTRILIFLTGFLLSIMLNVARANAHDVVDHAAPRPSKGRMAVSDKTPTWTIDRWHKQAKVPMPYRPTVIRGGCWYEEYRDRSCATYGTRTIWLVRMDRLTYYHEVGHLLDFGMEQKWRTWFAASLNAHSAWHDGDVDGEGGTPPLQEWFADVFATCAMYGVNPPAYLLTGGRTRYVTLEGYGGWTPRLSHYQSACRKFKYDIRYVGEEQYRPVLEDIIPFPA